MIFHKISKIFEFLFHKNEKLQEKCPTLWSEAFFCFSFKITGGNTATKTEQAERLILDLLADGKELASEDIVKAAAEAGISERTVQNAKRNMGGILGARRVGGQWYNFIKKKQPPEPAS